MGFLRNQLNNQDIICVSSSDWDRPYGSRQQIMSILAENNRVLYIEAQSSFLHCIKNPVREFRRFIRWVKGVSRKGSIYLFTPLPLLPFGNYSLTINRINQGILLLTLKRLMRAVGFKRPILWIYAINSGFLLGKMAEKFSVYHCIEDFSSEKANAKRRKVMLRLEEELLGKADMVMACSKSLWRERKKYRPDIYFLRNGIDLKLFSKAAEESCLPDDLNQIKSPKIGCVGTLNSRIDIDLISYLASARKDWQFIFIGDIIMRVKDKLLLKNLDNVHLLGFKHHDLLPRYIKAFDVCLIPYRLTDFNKYIFPLKTLEYLSMGKPVVSTCLPELEKFRDVVRLAYTREDFLDSIELFLNGSSREEELLRKETASRYSWDEKVSLLQGVIQKNLSQKEEKYD